MLNLSELLETAVNAAREGAAILQAYAHHRTDLVIDHKGRNDLVSQADRESEAAIIEILARETPDFGIVAEESGGGSRGIATWYIDPLDGTTNYLHGIPHWAVSIALVAQAGTQDEVGSQLEAETPVVAVVYDPCKEELFTAVHGVGAWLNEHRICCSHTASLEESLLGTGLPFRDFSFTDQYLPMLADAIQTSRGVRRVGAAALDMAWVACGRFDGYWEMGLAPWDLAAGTLLVREAGGIVEDMLGRQAWPRNGDVVAGNRQVQPLLNRMIRPHLRPVSS
jgi:myo-inositol-1(or 4)-monophosphatase